MVLKKWDHYIINKCSSESIKGKDFNMKFLSRSIESDFNECLKREN